MNILLYSYSKEKGSFHIQLAIPVEKKYHDQLELFPTALFNWYFKTESVKVGDLLQINYCEGLRKGETFFLRREEGKEGEKDFWKRLDSNDALLPAPSYVKRQKEEAEKRKKELEQIFNITDEDIDGERKEKKDE